MIKLTINDKEISVEENQTILEVAKDNSIHIPTLCHLNLHDIKMVNDDARCRVCVVDVGGRLVPSCATMVQDGMNIKTYTKEAIKARRNVVELLLSNHPSDCLICPRNGKCELQDLASELNIREIKFSGQKGHHEMDKASPSIVRNFDKCILCGRCEKMCNQIQTVGVYSRVNRGFNTIMDTAFNNTLIESPCTFCGQCVSVCPTAALSEVDHTAGVKDAINDPNKFVIVQTAPAVRVALGEMFNMDIGVDVTGKLISALRKLGFNKVMDTNFAADLTVVEETQEFLNRLQNNGPLPILTSCCPAWVNFIEYHYPELLDIPSSCKSPQQMFGAVAKPYLAEKLNIKEEDIVVVSIMPCLAKKYEISKDELQSGDYQDVDYVLSTRELARMIKEAGLDFPSLEDDSFDQLMGESTGAAVIFGTTGGVIEAVVRNASYLLTKNDTKVDFKELRGLKGIKEANVKIGDQELNIAIVHGLGNARILLDKIKNKEVTYHAIEIMACPGGCIGGGGQPFYLTLDEEILKKRAKAIYDIDSKKEKRISSENEEIKTLYKDFLGEIGGEKAHKLLHTHYKERVLK